MQRADDSNVYNNAAFEDEEEKGKGPKERADAARVSIMQIEKVENTHDDEESPPASFRSLYR